MKKLKAIGCLLALALAAAAQEMPADYSNVLKTLGKQGDFKSGVLKVNIPRGDLKVTIDGVQRQRHLDSVAGSPCPKVRAATM